MELMVIIVALIIFFIVISIHLSNPKAKGERGEARIVKDLDQIGYTEYEGYSLRNVYVPYNGKTTEIDVLYITSKGIVVVESKNYSGYIFGSENQRQWTATLYAGKYSSEKSHKYKFYNPIWQNRTHIKALQEYLGGVKAFSFIVFGTNCELKSITYNPENVCVCREDAFKKSIKNKFRGLDDIYDQTMVKELYNRLLPLTTVSEEMKERHVNAIKESARSKVCPRCGGTLVLRTARKGKNAGNQFYGCSNYPECRFIRNIE
ncbi:Topoisomerase DNA binding C4 zinc finger [Lachnospiraceae bacterium XBB1006]|nr:Topoisomerase DNA binding C4 zinc finger [Lachnospiraceae bacterium XBB1006]